MTIVSFLGLGTMGAPMAGHMKAKGFDVRAWTRSESGRQKWGKRFDGQPFADAATAVAGCDIVCMCLGRDEDVRSVVVGDANQPGILEAMKAGSILIDHTTTSAKLAREISDKCQKHGIKFMDAPVSGGQSGAENGKLTVMCGGEKDTYIKTLPILNCYSLKHDLMGEAGAGQLTKMVNQICIAGVLQALSEGIAFGEKAGLDVKQVISVISKGAAQSWQMDNRASTMTERSFDFGFAVRWMIKDLNYALTEADAVGSDASITKQIFKFYNELIDLGYENKDTSALICRLNRD